MVPARDGHIYMYNISIFGKKGKTVK